MNRALVILGAGLAAAPALAQVVSPNFRANSEGNDANTYPFCAPALARYQQAFGAGSLAPLLGRPIAAIAFRLDSSHTEDYTAGYVYPNIHITFSIAPQTIDHLSTDMAANVGPNPEVVFDGPYTVPTLHAGPAPHPFDMVLPLQHPFMYTGGVLLMDINSGIGPTQTSGLTYYLDSENTTGDAICRAYDVSFDLVYTDTRGLITQFTAGPAPCYANCDGSTTAPVLTVSDFTCFLNRFAAADTYANCDASTTPPVLNVGDFTCFLNRFSAGCS